MLSDNYFNSLQPQFRNPTVGDFHPVPRSNLFTITPKTISNFSWTDIPAVPTVPAGNADNQVTQDADTKNRSNRDVIGAYISSGCGDATNNGIIDIVDALAVARYAVNLPSPPPVNIMLADVNGDGNVNIIDALNIAKYSIGLSVAGTCLGN